MKFFTRTLFAAVLVAQAATLLAVNVVGTWKGKVIIDSTKLPPTQNAEGKKAMEQGLELVKKMVITLTLNSNKTYVADAKNVPGQKGPQKNEGTWKQEGDVIWMTATKDNGKPAKDKKPQKFLVAEGGKKLVLAADNMPPFVKVTFTR